MTDNWWMLSIPAGSPVAIVLDAGDDAANVWPQSLDLATRLVDQLPTTRAVQVYFLGCGTPYDGRQLRSQAARWREAHRTRTRLINPVFERLETEPCTTAVLLAAASPFDVEDWSSSRIIDRTICASMVDSPAACLVACACPPDIDHLIQRLQQTVEIDAVRISLPGAMPVEWNNSAFHLVGESLEARKAHDYSVRSHWLGAVGSTPQAECSRSDGSFQTLVLSHCAPVAAAAAWRTLSHHEANAYRDAIAGDEIRCPFGNHEHLPGDVNCRDGKNFPGKPFYGSDLAGYRGFVILRERAGGVESHTHSGEVLRLGPDLVAVYLDHRAGLKRFNPGTQAWIEAGDFEQYFPMGDDSHAIVL